MCCAQQITHCMLQSYTLYVTMTGIVIWKIERMCHCCKHQNEILSINFMYRRLLQVIVTCMSKMFYRWYTWDSFRYLLPSGLLITVFLLKRTHPIMCKLSHACTNSGYQALFSLQPRYEATLSYFNFHVPLPQSLWNSLAVTMQLYRSILGTKLHYIRLFCVQCNENVWRFFF